MSHVRYVGPMNQLRGKTGTARVTKAWEMVPPGFMAVQFDQLDLVVAGKPMAYGWAVIKSEYLRPERLVTHDFSMIGIEKMPPMEYDEP